MNAYVKQLKEDKIMLFCFSIGFFLIIISFIAVGFVYLKLPPFIPLFNQMPWGETRLGRQIEIFLPLGITLVIFITNGILASIIYSKNPLVSRILSVTSLLVSLFMILFIVRTIRLII